jgi:hypothetical protein
MSILKPFKFGVIEEMYMPNVLIQLSICATNHNDLEKISSLPEGKRSLVSFYRTGGV